MLVYFVKECYNRLHMTERKESAVAYLKEKADRASIEMSVICDGEVLYDNQVHTTFESSFCPYIEEETPHMILQSEVRNGRKLVIVEEPDLDRPGIETEEGTRVSSIYTLKLLEEIDDIHKANGLRMVRFRDDRSLDSLLSADESSCPTSLEEAFNWVIDGF